MAPRRAGDPASLVASSAKARDLLGWRPRWTELTPIIESAWRWHRDPPEWSPDSPPLEQTAVSAERQP